MHYHDKANQSRAMLVAGTLIATVAMGGLFTGLATQNREAPACDYTNKRVGSFMDCYASTTHIFTGLMLLAPALLAVLTCLTTTYAVTANTAHLNKQAAQRHASSLSSIGIATMVIGSLAMSPAGPVTTGVAAGFAVAVISAVAIAVTSYFCFIPAGFQYITGSDPTCCTTPVSWLCINGCGNVFNVASIVARFSTLVVTIAGLTALSIGSGLTIGAAAGLVLGYGLHCLSGAVEEASSDYQAFDDEGLTSHPDSLAPDTPEAPPKPPSHPPAGRPARPTWQPARLPQIGAAQPANRTRGGSDLNPPIMSVGPALHPA